MFAVSTDLFYYVDYFNANYQLREAYFFSTSFEREYGKWNYSSTSVNVIKSKCIFIWQALTYEHKFLGQQTGKLSRKVRFICSVESNSAVVPDGLISVLFEI